MTKVSGSTSAPELQSTENTDTLPPTPEAESKGFLASVASSAFDSIVDTVETAPGNIANGLVDTVKAGLEMAALPATMPKYVLEEVQTFLKEEKYENLTLNPSAALKRCVEGANDALKETYGKDALQITTDPKLEDVIYTAQVLTGGTDKSSQLQTAVAAFGVGVAHENVGIAEFAMKGPAYQALSENAGTVLNTAAGLGIGTLCPPLGLAVLASGPLKETVDGAFKSFDDNVAELRSNPAAARQWASVMTIPVDHRLEKMPVGDVFKQSFSIKAEAYEGIGGSLDVKVDRTVKKLDDGYEVIIKSTGGSSLGLGLGAQQSKIASKLEGEGGSEIKMVVKGEEAEKFIAAMGSSIEMGFVDMTKVQISAVDLGVEHSIGVSGDLAGGGTSAKIEFKNLEPSYLSAEFKLSNAIQFHVSGMPPEDDRNLKDCLKTMIEPSASQSLKAEAKYGLEKGKVSLELKLTTTSGSDRMEAEVKFEIKDPQKLANHFKIPVEELGNLSPEMILGKVGSIPNDIMQVSVSITGYEGYMGAGVKMPGMSVSMGQEHPTHYIRVPDPNNSDKTLSANIADARQQIVALQEGWNNERPVALKA